MYFVGSKNHLAHDVYALAVEEHVLCSAQADAFGAESYCLFRHRWRVGIGANIECTVLVGPAHYRLEKLVSVALIGFEAAFEHTFHFRIGALDHAFVNKASAAVYRDVIAFFENNFTRGEGLFVVVDDHFASAADTHFAQLASDKGRMR